MAHLTAFDSVDDTVRNALRQGLDQYTEEKNVPAYRPIPISVVAKDDSGAIIGGLAGETAWSWLYIDLLWVKKESRAKGIGCALVKRAERKAAERGCCAACLLTESFQAPGFYEKQGYQKFVVQEDFPPGHQRIGFMKRLAA
jgi:GNAT superfamily N-acetyltransferase